MQTFPEISAIINSFNYGHFVDEAITSVMHQSYTGPVEIIVVDDGSTDDTQERVAHYGDAVRYLRKTNGGQASALNAGVRASSGDIVMFLDADDYWHAEKVERVVHAFEHSDASCVWHQFSFIGPGSDVAAWRRSPAVSGSAIEDLRFLRSFPGAATSALSFRRSALERIGPIPEELSIMADGYLTFLSPFIGLAVGLSEPLAVYRFHGTNAFSNPTISDSGFRRKLDCQTVLCRELESWLRRNHWDLSNPEVARYLDRHLQFRDELRFSKCPPTRREWALHSLGRVRHLSPADPISFKLVQMLKALLSTILGPQRFEQANRWFRSKPRLQRLRREYAPSGADIAQRDPRISQDSGN